MARSAFFACLVLLCAPAAAQTMYRWTDAQGRVQYSDRLPKDFKGEVTRIEADAQPPPAAPIARPAPAKAEPAKVPEKPGDDLTPEQSTLFEELRAVRRHLAAGKPAYTVLPDAVLHAIAALRPTSLDELASIRGVGPAKLQQYGAALLAAVAGTSPADDAPYNRATRPGR